jgi:hypothetical protein
LIGSSTVNMLVPATNTNNSRKMVECCIFYKVRVLSEGRQWVYASPVSEHVQPKRWSKSAQSLHTIRYGLSFREIRNEEELCWRGPAAIYWTALRIPDFSLDKGSINMLLGKLLTLRMSFLCDKCRIKGK